MISRLSKNMLNNWNAVIHFHKKRETFDIDEKYYADGLTP